jgi:hypothetical protein
VNADVITWIVLGVFYLSEGAGLIYVRRVWPKRLDVLRDLTEVEVQLCREFRLIMQDLESRDPQLAEHMQLGYLQLDDMESQLRRTNLALRALKKAGL